MSDKDLSQCSLMELFRTEAETQLSLLTNGLLALEKDPSVRAQLEEMMRAAHSMKGAARIVNLGSVVKVAHAMEDCMVAVQKGVLQLQREQVDTVVHGAFLSHPTHATEWAHEFEDVGTMHVMNACAAANPARVVML